MGTVGSAVRAVNSYRRLPAVLGCSSGEAAPNLSFILIRRRPSLDRQTTLEFARFAVLNSWHGRPADHNRGRSPAQPAGVELPRKRGIADAPSFATRTTTGLASFANAS